jgi:hypothetical protein
VICREGAQKSQWRSEMTLAGVFFPAKQAKLVSQARHQCVAHKGCSLARIVVSNWHGWGKVTFAKGKGDFRTKNLTLTCIFYNKATKGTKK